MRIDRSEHKRVDLEHGNIRGCIDWSPLFPSPSLSPIENNSIQWSISIVERPDSEKFRTYPRSEVEIASGSTTTENFDTTVANVKIKMEEIVEYIKGLVDNEL